MTDMARSERFEEGLAPEAQRFLSSIHFDWRLLPFDIQGSMAHVAMLKHQAIIPLATAEKIEQGLTQILQEWSLGQLTPEDAWEDVHMNIEGRLHQIIGPEAGFLHTARSRNDQVATDMHLYMHHEGHALGTQLLRVMETLARLAKRTVDVVMPGYTHLQPAQPMLMAHHWLSYGWMFKRDYERLQQWDHRALKSPLGAGALTGTPYPTDPEFSAELLGIPELYENSLDAVSDRDFLLEFLSWSSILMVHVSRLAEELVLWSSQEFGYITPGDRYSTGSSIMPQKKNVDVAELLRGKSGRVFGNLTSLLTVMKGLPLAYNSDMQEDKEAVFDTVDTISKVLTVLPGLLDTLTIHNNRLFETASRNYTNATDLADRMTTEWHLPFREAHHRIGLIVRELIEHGYETFQNVPQALWVEVAPDIPYEWLQVLSPETLINARTQTFSTNRARVIQQLDKFSEWLLATQDDS